MRNRIAGASTVVLWLFSGCATAPEDPGAPQESCGAVHPRVGQSAALLEFAHDVSGTVRVVDDCTLQIEDFTFDGGGLDVRAIASNTGDFANGIILTRDLREGGARDGETLTIALPVGVSLDDVDRLSIWCVPAGANLAEAKLSK